MNDTNEVNNTVEQEVARNMILDTFAASVASLESCPEIIHQSMQDTPDAARLLHAAIGCMSEAGELADQMKRCLVYGKELDTTNLKEELGDILWYVQLACNVLGTSIDMVMLQNMAKLKVRYGAAWDFERMVNRDLDSERSAMQTAEAGA